MKKLMISVSAISLLALSGCVMPMAPAGAVGGSIYTDVSGPLLVTSHAASSKMGQATSRGILGFATGDSSIKTAAANGGITKIHNVDFHTRNVLCVWGETTVTVYGE